MLKADHEYERVEISVATPNDLVDVSNGRSSEPFTEPPATGVSSHRAKDVQRPRIMVGAD